MKPCLAILGLLTLLPQFLWAQATSQNTLENDYRNTFSMAGPPVATSPVPTANQFNSGSPFSGWQTTLIKVGDSVLAGSTTPGETGPTTLIYPSDKVTDPVTGLTTNATVTLESSIIGRPILSFAVDYRLGDEILPPTEKPDKSLAPANFYKSKPKLAGDGTDLFYYSVHAQKVFATTVGTINITWLTQDGTEYQKPYTVGATPVKPTRTIYWTELPFNGPAVQVPSSSVSAVNVVYTQQFRSTVTEAERYKPATEIPRQGNGTTTPPELRTFWYDSQSGTLRAYNTEGRVVVEYLGNLKSDAGVAQEREFLGIEIVDVVREARPTSVTTYLGEQVLPPSPGLVDSLSANVVAGFDGSANSYLHEQYSQSGTKRSLYAIRTTRPITFVADQPRPVTNEVLIYWMEPGVRMVPWPKYYAGYDFRWPSYDEAVAEKNYSIYACPSPGGGGNPIDTAVKLNGLDTPTLLFQSDPFKQNATLDGEGRFFTNVQDDPANNLSLLRYTKGEDVYFERVLSKRQDQFDGATGRTALQAAEVGRRIEPPQSFEPLVGYINQQCGTAFNPDAYKNPFVAGFGAEVKRAIIPVNSLPGKRDLEVWWFKKNSPPAGSKIAPTLWPQVVQTYRIAWPSAVDSIVLASNTGSGDLTPQQQAGKIYYRNDPSEPGYNPNEEHAIMLSGRAWALRDDLNIASSSEPYVLVDYTDADGRPAMRVFLVKRETESAKFQYAAEAGKMLQAPLPLPLLPIPKSSEGHSLNTEVASGSPDPVPAFDATRDKDFTAYNKFTFIDRTGTHWVFRGPHSTGSPSFGMQYKYIMQDGFAFPGLVSPPKPGAVLPYLRPYTNGVDRTGGFTGDADKGTPLTIPFKPTWPTSVPILRVAETLTLPKVGLPAVRGQRSVQLLYQQSIAQNIVNKAQSAILHDPTRQKTSAISVSGLVNLPASLKTSNLRGLTYFPNLPPHLSARFYFDPNKNKPGSLVFGGEYIASTTGESYLLPSVTSDDDLTALKGLVASTDADKAKWDAAIEALSTTLETFIENPAVKGAFVADHDKDEKVGPTAPSEIKSDNIPVSSYALTGVGGGTGYVVLIAGNGINTSIVPSDEPIAMQVLKVELPFYRGEVKVVKSDNPLDEKLSLQHTGDFAGKPQDFDFEWRYHEPSADGTPPRIYSISPVRLVADGSWSVLEVEPNGATDYRTQEAVPTSKSSVSLPGALAILNTSAATGPTDVKRTVLHRSFAVSNSERPQALYLSWNLASTEGAAVYLNGILVAAKDVPGLESAGPSTLTGSPFVPLSTGFPISPDALKLANAHNILTVELYSKRDPGTLGSLNVRLESAAVTETLENWIAVDSGQPAAPGKNRHIIGGAGLLTLTDNFFTVRYRPNKSGMAGYGAGWSQWVDPMLAEGWIKRALAGINPFNQRITDLYNNAVNTQVSLVTQAGTQYEGAIALNVDNLNSTGLIEIYETILRRGRSLSIEATPPINNAGANSALTLAAGYITDLYAILGNEAYADAENPTIGVGINGQYGDINTSRFAFKGQVASILDEELALLRGRDDFLPPSTQTRPFYNRLFWNYTRGIDAGEQFYASNYNLKDTNNDGIVNAIDAQATYPQGHGDAYGHYLSALKSFYSLLKNPNFSWVPRTETLNIANTNVQVGYQDERRFALAAASLTRSLQQIVDLTYRQNYTPSGTQKWTEFRDATVNTKTIVTRYWGLDEWATRGGQGAFFHWVTVNSLLPATDPAPTHQGIQKIDRTTVVELDEIASNAQAIQNSLQNADARLNPLGLTSGAMAFDISPSEVDAGLTHYEQIYLRALAALSNANLAFEKAQESNALLRAQSDNTASQKNAIDDQERAYNNQLIEIYGTPYADDIGPGRTFPQEGYAGPDTVHYSYIDLPEEKLVSDTSGQKTYTLYLSPKFNPNKTDQNAFTYSDITYGNATTYTVSVAGQWQKPATWLGRRATPGKIQAAVSELYLARKTLKAAANYASTIMAKGESEFALYKEKIDFANNNQNYNTALLTGASGVAIATASFDATAELFGRSAEIVDKFGDGAIEAFPLSAGLSFDVTSFLRSGTHLAKTAVVNGMKASQSAAKIASSAAKATGEVYKNTTTNIQQAVKLKYDNQQLLYGLGSTINTFAFNSTKDLESALRRFENAQMALDTLVASGERIQVERLAFRKRAAAVTQGYRTNDYLFRTFRTEALERYKALFDLSARYTFLAAKAYDYETGLLDTNTSTQAASFFQKIVRARSPGVISGGQPDFGGSSSGDPGLSGVLAQMNADWSVAKTRLGFNNPDQYETTFSLRREKFRILGDKVGDANWRDLLRGCYCDDIMDDPDVRRHALQLGVTGDMPVPGFVIDFGTSIRPGYNFFGQPLAGGDSIFGSDSFATKIRSSGIAFEGYPGLDSPATTTGALGSLGASSPSDPPISVTNSAALNATPYIYLLPTGADVMQSPPIGGVSATRSWSVEDHAIPLPFNIGGTAFASDSAFVSANSLSESQLVLRKHQSFRAVPSGTVFSSSPGFTNRRLIGRSVANTRWKIVIPANTLLSDTQEGSEIFIQSIKDIKLHFQTYSYSGN
jgi:hypothetical protein